MKAPSDEMAMRPLTEGTKRRTGLEKRLAWELERWAQALVLSDPVPTLRKTRRHVARGYVNGRQSMTVTILTDVRYTDFFIYGRMDRLSMR